MPTHDKLFNFREQIRHNVILSIYTETTFGTLEDHASAHALSEIQRTQYTVLLILPHFEWAWRERISVRMFVLVLVRWVVTLHMLTLHTHAHSKWGEINSNLGGLCEGNYDVNCILVMKTEHWQSSFGGIPVYHARPSLAFWRVVWLEFDTHSVKRTLPYSFPTIGAPSSVRAPYNPHIYFSGGWEMVWLVRLEVVLWHMQPVFGTDD